MPAAIGTPGQGAALDQRFVDEIEATTGITARLESCIQCGTCGGSCPSAADMDHTPRMLFALARAGLRDAVLRSNTPWMCLSCYFCAVRCPQEIHIPDVLYAIKSIAARAGCAPETVGVDFARTFVSNIEHYGRSYEVGLVTRHYLRHYATRLPGMAPMGIGMVTKGRMGFIPHKIRGIEGLRAILARAAALEATARRETPAGRETA